VVRRIVVEMKDEAGAETKQRSGQLTAERIEAIIKLAQKGEAGKFLQLPGGIQVRREHEDLVFARPSGGPSRKTKASASNFECNIHLGPVDTEMFVPITNLGCAFRFRVIDWVVNRGETTSIGSVLDRDTLRFPLVLRNWRPGDRLQAAGHRNARKLKRLLNEKHISRWQRDGWPVLTSGGTIAWARGFPVAAAFAVHERTRTGVLIVEERRS
jgi:tRNA(Ile)-lysidine synthase